MRRWQPLQDDNHSDRNSPGVELTAVSAAGSFPSASQVRAESETGNGKQALAVLLQRAIDSLEKLDKTGSEGRSGGPARPVNSTSLGRRPSMMRFFSHAAAPAGDGRGRIVRLQHAGAEVVVQEELADVFEQARELAGLQTAFREELCDARLGAAPEWLFNAADAGKIAAASQLGAAMWKRLRQFANPRKGRSPKHQTLAAWTSASGRLVLSELTAADASFLRYRAKEYVKHVEENPSSLLCRVLALYMLRGADSSMRYFAVFLNALPFSGRNLDYAYMLRGYTEKRFVPRSGVAGQVLQDGNFVEEQQVMVVPENAQRQLIAALQADTRFLKKLRVVGYSLVLGMRKLSPEEDFEHDSDDMDPSEASYSWRRSSVFRAVGSTASGTIAHRGWRPSGEAVLYYFGIVDILKPVTATAMTRYYANVVMDKLAPAVVASKVQRPGDYRRRLVEFVEGRLLPADEQQANQRTPRGRVETPRGRLESASLPRFFSTDQIQSRSMSRADSNVLEPSFQASSWRDDGCADTLAIVAAAEQFDERGAPDEAEVARWCAFSDGLQVNEAAMRLWLDLGLLRGVDLREFSAFVEELQRTVLPPVRLKTAAEERPSGIARMKIKQMLKAATALGRPISDSSCQYSLALAIAVGVEVATRCSTRIADRADCCFQRCAALRRRPAAALTTRHFFLPEEGSWLSAPHMLPNLRFQEKAPEIFRDVRLAAGYTDDDYISSVCQRDFSFIEFTTNSKSGEFFFFTHDGRCMVKTISNKEAAALVQMLLKGYREHISAPEGSLLTRILGLYQVQLPAFNDGRPKHFLVQENIFFHCGEKVSESFDLKGSTVGRSSRPGEPVQKDNDWIEKGYKLGMPDAAKERLLRQHRRDCEFLARCGVIDYSVLLAVSVRPSARLADFSSVVKGAKAASRSPRQSPSKRRSHVGMLARSEASSSHRRVSMIKKAASEGRPHQLWDILRREVLPSSPYGPFPVEAGQCFLGIIDFLVPWNLQKKAEYALKSATGKAWTASVNPPMPYAARQMRFIESIL
eukprot:TRINITY_DN50707_c0_g1_i1.p1 TRINITY_DN50707_c0_g1~~TRINITY_DN50707_c0_g1_i1.p1  ORF type:complete len:1034 (-),score=201.33 TRINITY_DN50707_c0_g1_i1:90-3191(-)